MRTRLGMVLLLMAWSVIGELAPAHASPSPPAARPTRVKAKRVVVLVASRTQRKVSTQVARAIRNHLLDLRVGLRMHWVNKLPGSLPEQVAAARHIGRRAGAVVVLWCSHATVDQVFLYITRFKGGRILVRQVDRARDGTLGRFEAIGAIVRSSVEAILQGARIGIRPPPPLPQRPAPSPPRPHSPGPKPRGHRLGMTLDMGYAMAGFAPEEPLLHAGAVGVSLILHPNWALRLSYRFAPSIHVKHDGLGAELRIFHHGLRLGGVLRWPLGRWTLALQANLALGVQSWSVTAPAPLRAAPDAVDLTFGVDVLAMVSWQARPWLAIYGGLGATALLWNRTYDANVGGQRPVLLAPFPVQPQLVIGLRFVVL